MELWTIHFPPSVALAVVAAVGYLVGRRAGKTRDDLVARSNRDLRHSRSVAREMDKISRSLRTAVARYQGDLKRIGTVLREHREAVACAEECESADEPLDCALFPSSQAADGTDLRREDDPFVTVADARPDPLALDWGDGAPGDSIATQYTMLVRHGSEEFAAATPLPGPARNRVKSPC